MSVTVSSSSAHLPLLVQPDAQILWAYGYGGERGIYEEPITAGCAQCKGDQRKKRADQSEVFRHHSIRGS